MVDAYRLSKFIFNIESIVVKILVYFLLKIRVLLINSQFSLIIEK